MPMKHTPGPWVTRKEKSFHYSINTDYAHDRGHDHNVVREVRCEANANLIAAAPQLLSALKEAYRMIEGDDAGAGREPLEIIAAMREAIAKAEGRMA